MPCRAPRPGPARFLARAGFFVREARLTSAPELGEHICVPTRAQLMADRRRRRLRGAPVTVTATVDGASPAKPVRPSPPQPPSPKPEVTEQPTADDEGLPIVEPPAEHRDSDDAAGERERMG